MAKFKKGQVLRERYTLVEPIGRGGFSVVWLGHDNANHDAQVAVKVFAPYQGLDDADLEQFNREYSMTTSLNDSRLLKAIDYFIVDDSPCLVFPYMAKGSLSEQLRKSEGIMEQEIAKLIYHIGGALKYLHGQPPPVLHLDIKPENILVNLQGDYLLSDFGISQQMRTTMLKDSPDHAQALLTHMAPETIEGKRPAPPVDIFAFGVTLYECCEGILDKSNLIGYRLNAGIKNLPEIDKKRYSKRLEELIHFCLQATPEDRPDAALLQKFARHYLDHKFWPAIKKEELPPPPSPPPPPPSPTQPSLWKWVSIATSAVLGVVALVYFFRPTDDIPAVESPSLGTGYKLVEKFGKFGYVDERGDTIVQPVHYRKALAAVELGEELFKNGKCSEALKVLNEPSNREDFKAQYLIGLIYQDCSGMKDFTKAKNWYEKAAKIGSTGAKLRLGIMYKDGLGVATDFGRAKEWLEGASNDKSESEGSTEATYYLGVIFETGGPGLAANITEAQKWYCMAAINRYEPARAKCRK